MRNPWGERRQQGPMQRQTSTRSRGEPGPPASWGRAFYLCDYVAASTLPSRMRAFPVSTRREKQQHQPSDSHRINELRVSQRCRIAWLRWEKGCSQGQVVKAEVPCLAPHLPSLNPSQDEQAFALPCPSSTPSTSKRSHTGKRISSQRNT